ncbi:hypothetical protein EII17_08115 [Clostridiales bacterium COT073_COT-073]|nr:hypothetical protein EII17_08115 [Clostridiales bacterium COT073_COT-073]
MKLDEKWIRAHLPEDCRDEPIDVFSGMYLDGLKVMSYGERGNPDEILYEAKDEENLRWWQLDKICYFVGKTDKSKIWRWYRDHVENDQWYYSEHRHYDYNAIDDPRLPNFERYLRNLKYAFPSDYFEEKVKEYTALMNHWYLVPHWGYDYEHLCFIEISDSKEYSSDFDKSEEPKPETIIRVIE